MVKKKESIKQEVVSIPASTEEAAKWLGRIGILQRQIARVNMALDNTIQKIKQRAAERVMPRQEEVDSLAEGIFIFAQAHRKKLTEDEKRKTIVWPSGQILWRWTPFSVNFRKKEAAIEALKKAGLERFIRIEEEVNKEAILQEKEAIAEIKEITVSRKEFFVVKPAKTEIEIPKEIKIAKK